MRPVTVSAGMPGPLSSITMRVGLRFLPIVMVTLMTGAIPASSQTIDAVINQLFDDNQQPTAEFVASLRDQFFLGAKFHQARRGERHALDLMHWLVIHQLRSP